MHDLSLSVVQLQGVWTLWDILCCLSGISGDLFCSWIGLVYFLKFVTSSNKALCPDWASEVFCYDYRVVFDLVKLCVFGWGFFFLHLLRFVQRGVKLSDQLKCFEIFMHIELES